MHLPYDYICKVSKEIANVKEFIEHMPTFASCKSCKYNAKNFQNAIEPATTFAEPPKPYPN